MQLDRQVVTQPATPKQQAARFLTQATFGPRKSEVETLSASLQSSGSSALQQWVIAQMQVPPTLHRAFWRERANPVVLTDVAPGGTR